METIQVVLDAKLLKAADRAAGRTRMNRSVLIRMALRNHLKRIETEELESRDRYGYRRRPDNSGEASVWEQGAVWPER